jgi:hypothetical protein
MSAREFLVYLLGPAFTFYLQEHWQEDCWRLWSNCYFSYSLLSFSFYFMLFVS